MFFVENSSFEVTELDRIIEIALLNACLCLCYVIAENQRVKCLVLTIVDFFLSVFYGRIKKTVIL